MFGVLFFHVCFTFFSESQISRLTDDEAKALGAVEALHPQWWAVADAVADKADKRWKKDSENKRKWWQWWQWCGTDSTTGPSMSKHVQAALRDSVPAQLKDPATTVRLGSQDIGVSEGFVGQFRKTPSIPVGRITCCQRTLCLPCTRYTKIL